MLKYMTQNMKYIVEKGKRHEKNGGNAACRMSGISDMDRQCKTGVWGADCIWVSGFWRSAGCI